MLSYLGRQVFDATTFLYTFPGQSLLDFSVCRTEGHVL